MIYLFLFFFQVIQNCSIGCLLCNDSKKCQICDINNGYFLREQYCTKIHIENCKIFSLEGQCLECQDHYRFGLDKQKCVLAKKLLKCQRYDVNNQCIACKRDYYIQNGVCTMVEVFIKNCAVYLDKNKCQQCDDEFLLSFDKKFCIFQGDTENCKYWSQIKCNKCKEGYIKNISVQMDILQQNSDFFLDYFDQGIQMKNFQFCKKVKVKNCEVLQNFNKCSKCKEGYFLNQQNDCMQYPLPSIEHCIKYENPDICKDCLQGFYLQENRCKKVTLIDNCAFYDTQSSSSQCIKCNLDYYLQNNSCILRNISINQQIQNCIQNEIQSDRCALCSESYFLSQNGQLCLQKIQNCEQHQVSIDNKITCKICIDGFYLDQGSCIIGTITNCLQYQSQDKCLKCENQFYLTKNQLCAQHIDIDDCELYDGQTSLKPNSCLKCKQNSYNFKIQVYCKQVPIIQNCAQYNQYQNEGKCIRCIEGYFLNDLNKCELFNNPNCSNGISMNICTQCFPGYTLNQDQQMIQCVQPYNFIEENCYANNIQKINSLQIYNVQCNSCKKDSIFLEVKDTFICLEKYYLLNYQISEELQIENCQKYYPQIGCIQCIQGYYLEDRSGIKQCVQQCSDDYSLKLITLRQQDDKYQVYLNDQCILKNNNCEHYAPKVFGPYKIPNYQQQTLEDMYICIKCKQDRIEVVDRVIINFTNINFDQYQRDQYVKNLYDFFPEVKCYYPIFINQKPVEEKDVNCKYFIELNNSQNIGCSVCKFGFSGKIQSLENYTYVNNCTKDSQCFDNFQYTGLHSYYQNYIQCFKCVDIEKIVVLKIETQIIENILYIKQFSQQNIGNKNYQCLMQSEIYKSNEQIIPQYCQFVIINTNQEIQNFQDNQKSNLQFDENNPPNLSIFCGSCQPAYAPEFINYSNQHIVTNCKPIQYCDNNYKQDILNKCSKCQNGYIFLYEEDQDIQMKQNLCIQHSDSNCYAAKQIEQFFYQCKLCNKGYYLNKDYICEQIKAPSCNDFQYSIFQQQYQQRAVLDYYYYAFPQGSGCNYCQENFVAVQILNQQKICVFSTYLQDYNNSQRNNVNKKSVFINQCEIYSEKDDQYICQQCTQGFILTIDQKQCVNYIKNCLISSLNKDKCAQCEDGYALIQHKCQLGDILNCQFYYTGENKSTMLCKTCQEQFIKSSDEEECQYGLVQNCAIYEENLNTKCNQCLPGYILEKRILDICYPIDPILKCQNAKFDDGIICTKCIEQNYIFVQQFENNTELLQQTICMKHNLVQFCQTYHIQDTFQNNNFQCIECQQNFYIKNYKCEPRKNIHPSCQIYNLNEDLCQKCVTGNYLSFDKKSCKLYPNGLVGCIKYSEQNVCKQCLQNFYLKDGQCEIINQQDEIQNCKNYIFQDKQIICQNCIQQYYLVDQQCIRAKVQNCLTYQDENNCSSCVNGYKLQINNSSQTNCEKIQLNNCIQSNTEYPHECQICDKGFFLNQNNLCEQVENQINSCIQYKSKEKCQICEENYILSTETYKCLYNSFIDTNLDKNCEQNIFQFQPICQGCISGYVLMDGLCVRCENNQGCAYCSPQNLSLCYMCQSGYYQDENGQCIQILQEIIENKIKILYINFFIILLIKF